MRRVTLLCSLILVVAQLSAQTAGAVSFKTFVSARNHYHIVYPATWRVRRVSIHGTHYDIFLGPTLRSSWGLFRVNVNVAIDSAGAGRTTRAYARAAESANAAQGALTDARGRTTIAGGPAWFLRGHLNRLRHNDFHMVVFVRAGHGWQITLSAPHRYIGRFRDLFNIMLASFYTT